MLICIHVWTLQLLWCCICIYLELKPELKCSNLPSFIKSLRTDCAIHSSHSTNSNITKDNIKHFFVFFSYYLHLYWKWMQLQQWITSEKTVWKINSKLDCKFFCSVNANLINKTENLHSFEWNIYFCEENNCFTKGFKWILKN